MKSLNEENIKKLKQKLTANACLQELRRENAKRREVFGKWAAGNIIKQQKYEHQLAATEKLENLFSVIKKEEWQELNARFEEREKARNVEQKSLF